MVQLFFFIDTLFHMGKSAFKIDFSLFIVFFFKIILVTQKDCITPLYLCIIKTKEVWLSGRKQHSAKVPSRYRLRRFESFCFRNETKRRYSIKPLLKESKHRISVDYGAFFVYFCFKMKTIQHRLAVISWSISATISATEILPSQKCSRDD